MKKFLLSICLILLCNSVLFANESLYSAAKEKPLWFYNSEYFFDKKNIVDIIPKFIGDTIHIEFESQHGKSMFYLSFLKLEPSFSLEQPDTIWIVEGAKKPKLGKHYKLNYNYTEREYRINDYKDFKNAPEKAIGPDGSFSADFVILSVLINDADNSKSLARLLDLSSKKIVLWKLNTSGVTLSSKSISDKFAKDCNKFGINYVCFESYNPKSIYRMKISHADFKLVVTKEPYFEIYKVKNKSYIMLKEVNSLKENKKLITVIYNLDGSHIRGAETPYFINDKYGEPVAQKMDSILYEDKMRPLWDKQRDSVFVCKVSLNDGLYYFGYDASGKSIDIMNKTFFIYSISDYEISDEILSPCYMAICGGKKYFLPKDYHIEKKMSSEDIRYLARRKHEGEQLRLDLALQADKEYRSKINAAYAQAKAKTEAQKEAKRKELTDNEIFLIGRYLHNNWGFLNYGIDIYNCFGKTIKYISYTLRAYNSVGDVQEDFYNRSSVSKSRARFISPKECSTYYDENILYDKDGEIKNIRLVSITFTFTDGTTRSYNTWSEIKKHYKEISRYDL